MFRAWTSRMVHPRLVRRGFSTVPANDGTVKLSDADMAAIRQITSKRKSSFLETCAGVALVTGSALFIWYTKEERDERLKLIDSGTYDAAAPRPSFTEWLQRKVKSFSSADCDTFLPSNETLTQLARQSPQAHTDQFLLWQRLHGFPPSPDNKEPTTGIEFPTVRTLPVPVQTATGGYVLPASVALVGVGLRAMLNWWWLPAARAYSYAVYVSTIDYARHFVDQVQGKADPSHTEFAPEFPQVPSKAVVLQFTQGSQGSHIAHGFERTFGNRIEDGRPKRNMLGQRVDMAGDGSLGIHVDANGNLVEPHRAAASPEAANTDSLGSFFQNLFTKKPSPQSIQRTPDTYGVGGVLALEALRCTADAVPTFVKDDQMVFSWGRDNDAVMVSMAGKQGLDVDKLRSCPLASANALALIQQRVKEQHMAAFGGALPPAAVVKGVEAAVAHMPSCWEQRGDGVLFFDSQRVLPAVNDIIGRASRGEVVSAADFSIPPSPTDWVTANMSEADKRKFIKATGVSSSTSSTPSAAQKKAGEIPLLTNARVVIRDPVLSLAIMKTYVGDLAISGDASAQMNRHWGKV